MSDVDDESRTRAGGSTSGLASAADMWMGDSERRPVVSVVVTGCAPLTPDGSEKGLVPLGRRESGEESTSKTSRIFADLTSVGGELSPLRGSLVCVCCLSGDPTWFTDVVDSFRTESMLAFFCNVRFGERGLGRRSGDATWFR